MSKKTFVPYTLILCALWLNSCSVLMARNENERRGKIEQEHIGRTKEELEKYWGPPLATVMHDDGSKTCVYEFNRLAQKPQMTKESGLIVGDILTLGIAEIFFVPGILAENYILEKRAFKVRGFVTYDLDNRVKTEKCILIE